MVMILIETIYSVYCVISLLHSSALLSSTHTSFLCFSFQTPYSSSSSFSRFIAEFLHGFFSCNHLVVHPAGHIVAYQRKHKGRATNIVTCFYRQAIPFRPEAHDNRFNFQFETLTLSGLHAGEMRCASSHWNGYRQWDQVGHNKV